MLQHEIPGQQICYTDGAAYERTIGRWSRLAGERFLAWLAPPPNLGWIDVGCGNGSFTELLVGRCAPRAIAGIDPAEAQLAYARSRPACRTADFLPGDATALPFPDETFDAAVMALVIFFVPDPAKGVAEMKRVVKRGGMLAAYAWDMMNGGFPFNSMQIEMRALGIPPTYPPMYEVSRLEALGSLWRAAGLAFVETFAFTVQRTYDDFDDLWMTSCLTASVAPKLATMPAADVDRLKTRMRACSPPDASGRITVSARVTATKGRVRAH
jgi:SAM-dependent methyltransferase